MDEEIIDTTPLQTYTLELTKNELVHLRDLFAIMLPPNMEKSVSQSLAEICGRPLNESKMWLKVAAVCEEANVPVGEKAPDFMLMICSAPAISVFEMQHDSQDVETSSGPFFTEEVCDCENCESECGKKEKQTFWDKVKEASQSMQFILNRTR